MHSYHRSRFRRVAGGTILRIAALIAIHIICAAARAGETTTSHALPRPQDEVWLISSRSLGCSDLRKQVAHLQYWRYDREHCWTKASLDELSATDKLSATDDPTGVTTIFVHGNRISHDDAFDRGWSAYRELARCAGERPLRFVIWSWPSDAVHGPLNDARVKACRTDPEAFYLAWFVDRLSAELPVSFWGHSFGARVVTGALHLLGGGVIAGNRLDERLHPARQPMQMVTVAAALDNDWLLQGHCHGQALSQLASVLLVNNGCDMLLKRYRRIYADHGHEQALGYVGFNTSLLPAADAAKITQIDACCQVGKHHTLEGYLASPFLMARMRPYLLFTSGQTPPEAHPEMAAERPLEETFSARSE